MNANDLADQPGFHGFSHISEMRRPAAVLVDRKPDAILCGTVAEAFPNVEIEHEWLLRQHMLEIECARREEKSARKETI